MPIYTRLEIESANKRQQAMVDLNTRVLVADAEEALADMVRAVRKLWSCGANVHFLEDTLCGLFEFADAVQTEADRQVDDVGLEPVSIIDKSELAELLTEIRK